jgi:hypothetical protein
MHDLHEIKRKELKQGRVPYSHSGAPPTYLIVCLTIVPGHVYAVPPLTKVQNGKILAQTDLADGCRSIVMLRMNIED